MALAAYEAICKSNSDAIQCVSDPLSFHLVLIAPNLSMSYLNFLVSRNIVLDFKVHCSSADNMHFNESEDFDSVVYSYSPTCSSYSPLPASESVIQFCLLSKYCYAANSSDQMAEPCDSLFNCSSCCSCTRSV